ncbi:MAG TPA: DUF4167 domain-containing protein [Amaricoccus sp.]|nr:DUF4167 domain-containing protein [Amaricoccus sp.]
MRPSNKQRSRNKPGNNGGQHNQQRRPNMGNIINRVFESAGPDGKVRGTPQQIIDKYQLLARDAQLSGDRVAAESYLQHAEHYSRLLGDAQRQQQENRFNQEREEGRRDEEAPREERPTQRFDEGFEPQRRQQAAPQPVASGLAMIEPDDSFDLSGPIETPEGRRSEGPTPIVELGAQAQPAEAQPAPARPVNGAGHAAAADEAPVELAEPQAQPVKRSRPRRRSKPAGEVQAPEVQTSEAQQAE